MPTEPQKKGPTKAQKRLQKRQSKHESILAHFHGRYDTNSMRAPGSLNGRKYK